MAAIYRERTSPTEAIEMIIVSFIHSLIFSLPYMHFLYEINLFVMSSPQADAWDVSIA